MRAEWERIYAERSAFTLRGPADAPPLFLPMFDYAAGLESGTIYDDNEGRAFIRETLGNYLN